MAFTRQNHYPFIIDEIKFTQNLKAGDRVYTFLDNSEEIEEEETSYTLTQLAQPKANHTYASTCTERECTTTRRWFLLRPTT